METWLKVVIGLALLYGTVSGWRNGLMKELLSSGGFIIGLVLAWYFHDYVAGGGVMGFIIIVIAAPVALGFLAMLLNVFFDHMFVLGTMNRFAGALVGFLKFAILIGGAFLLADYLGLSS